MRKELISVIYAMKTDRNVYCWFDTDKGLGGYVKDVSELDSPYVFKGLLKQDARTEKTLIRMSWNMEMERKEGDNDDILR